MTIEENAALWDVLTAGIESGGWVVSADCADVEISRNGHHAIIAPTLGAAVMELAMESAMRKIAEATRRA